MPEVLPTERTVLPNVKVLRVVDPKPPGVLPWLPLPSPMRMLNPLVIIVVAVGPEPLSSMPLALMCSDAERVKEPDPSKTKWLAVHALMAVWIVDVLAPELIVDPHCVREPAAGTPPGIPAFVHPAALFAGRIPLHGCA